MNEQKGIFKKTANELFNLVGKNNFNYLTSNLNTIRFNVIDKKIVDDQKIDQLELVKEHVWIGSQLQVTVNLEDAKKIHNQIENLLNDSINDFNLKKSSSKTHVKKGWKKQFFDAVNGIAVPLMPLLILSGMLMGISSSLSAAGLIKTLPPEGELFKNFDVWSMLMYILSNSGIALLSIFFCYSTVKYLNGNAIIGIMLGLMIASRYFIGPVEKHQLGSNTWPLFDLWGDHKVAIKGYNNGIIPAVGVGLAYVYLDRFIKKWMPRQVDIIFRPLLSVGIVFFFAFFVLLPILEIVQFGLEEAVKWFFAIPYGIGGAIVGFIWIPLVFMGVSWVASLSLDIGWITSRGDIPLKAFLIYNGLALAMLGTLLALLNKQSNAKERMQTIGAMSPLLFGIVDPAVYGILVRKPKLFWMSNLAGALIGFLLSLFNVTENTIAGAGILAVLGNIGNWRDMALYLLFSLISGIFIFFVVYFFYNEKKNEYQLIKQSLAHISGYVWFNNRKDKTIQKTSRFTLKQQLNGISKKAKQLKQGNKEYSKTFKKYQQLFAQVETKNHSLEKKQKQFIKKINKTKWTKYKVKLETKMNLLVDETKVKLETIANKIVDQKKLLNEQATKLNETNQEFFNYSEKELKNFLINNQITTHQEELLNKFWNSLNDNLIVTKALETRPDQIDKADYYQTTNKHLLKLLPNYFK